MLKGISCILPSDMNGLTECFHRFAVLDRESSDAGEVSGEVRLPHSVSRGFRFATTSSGSNPATVQLPVPWFGRAHDTSAVVLDGIDVPQSVALHHAEAKGMMDPLKTTSWEGDNMMLVPYYKCDPQPSTA